VATLTDSTVRDNSAGVRGGGIAVGTTNLIRSTVNDNSAGTDGGGIHAFRVNLTNATVSGNSAGVAGSGAGGGTLARSLPASGVTPAPASRVRALGRVDAARLV
jgi:predicted outer membrane repeat protein